MATAEQIKAWAFDRIVAMAEEAAPDAALTAALLGRIASVQADVERDLKNADPSEADERGGYFETVESLATDILAAHPTNDRGEWSDAAHEAVDGNYYLIYTRYHVKILDWSDNRDEGMSQGLVDLASCDDFAEAVQAMAFWAMLRDVEGKIESLREERDEAIEGIISEADEAGADCFAVPEGSSHGVYTLDVDGYLEALEADGGEIWTAEELADDGRPGTPVRLIAKVYPTTEDK